MPLSVSAVAVSAALSVPSAVRFSSPVIAVGRSTVH